MRRIISSVILAGILCLCVTTGFAFSIFGFGNSDKLLTPENGVLSIPLNEINDGAAHYFRAKADNGVTVRFFTLKSEDGVVRAAMDACDVCYKAGKGYVQEGHFMVCRNCGQKFASQKINEVKGGCNPAPLKRSVENGMLIISWADINANSWYFNHGR